MALTAENTTTGLHSLNLVIKPGFFQQGRTYIIELRVATKSEPLVATLPLLSDWCSKVVAGASVRLFKRFAKTPRVQIHITIILRRKVS